MNNVQRILKRVLACTAAIVLAVTLCLAAAAEVAYQPTAQFFVNDFADVLSAQTEQEIVELGRALQQQTGAQAVAVTVPSLGGQSVEDYAIDLANSWGIGQAEEDNGVLILIAVEERKLRVEVGLGLEGALPDGKTGRIMDEYMSPPCGKTTIPQACWRAIRRSRPKFIRNTGLKPQSFLVTRLPTTKILETDRIFPLC